MYKYQCSKNDCGANWTLREGKLNGFVLTCPVCGKGRGLFTAQLKNIYIEQPKEERVEEMVITVEANTIKSAEDFEIKISDFIKKHSIQVVSKSLDTSGKNYVCTLQYRLKNRE